MKTRQRGYFTLPGGLGVHRPADTSAPGILDSYLTGLWGGYSLDKLNGAYAGPCLRIRRSNDDAEQDIGFSGSAIDSAALLSFTGANSGFVVTFYDQSGGSNHLTQATAANQPLLVDGTGFLNEIFFDGVNDVLTSVNDCGTTNYFTVHALGRIRLSTEATGTNWGILYSKFPGATIVFLSVERDAARPNDYMTAACEGGGYEYHATTPTKLNQLYSTVYQSNVNSLADKFTHYYDGVVDSAIATFGSATYTATWSIGKWHLSDNSGSKGMKAFRTFLVYEAGQDGTTVANISSALPRFKQVDGLDTFTSTLWGVYSLRRRLSSYSGACLRVRRSSDNTEQDVGFVEGLLDTASLLTFAGAGSAFVVTWYDQSGGAKHLTQATTANQPRLVNSGVVDAAVFFDGTNDALVGPNSGTPSAFTVHAVANANGVGAAGTIAHQNDWATTTGAILYYSSAGPDTRVGVTTTSISNRANSGFAVSPGWQVLTARMDRAASGGANKAAMFSSGRRLTRTVNQDAGTTPTGNFVAAPWKMGEFSGEIETLVIYETAQSDATVELVARRLG